MEIKIIFIKSSISLLFRSDLCLVTKFQFKGSVSHLHIHHGFFRSNCGENSSFSSTDGRSSSVEFGVKMCGDCFVCIVYGIESPIIIVGRSFWSCCCSCNRHNCFFISCLSSLSRISCSKRRLEQLRIDDVVLFIRMARQGGVI